MRETRSSVGLDRRRARGRARRAARAGARSTRRRPCPGSRTPARSAWPASRWTRHPVADDREHLGRAASSSSWPNDASWSGERITTSCAPVTAATPLAERPSRRPGSRRSGRGSARRARASPASPARRSPVRCTSGGVIVSLPGAERAVGRRRRFESVGGATVNGRAARSTATITVASADRVVTELGHPEGRYRSVGRVAWLDARAPRDHRWWTRRQHRGDRRRDARRRGHAHRARHHRRRRAPVGLHPVEGDDRDRRRALGADPGARDGPASPRAASTSTRCASGSRRSRTTCTTSVADAARVAGRAPDPRAPAGCRARTRSSPRPRRASEQLDADFVVLATGSRPRIPDWAPVDGERILTTRQAYPPPEIPEHLCVIGSGVTGVEFTHMFSALGSQVTLVVSRQQVLPMKDPEVAAVLEDEFLAPRREAAEGRAGEVGRPATATRCSSPATTAAASMASHVVLAIGSVPNPRTSGSTRPGSRSTTRGYVAGQPQLPDQRRATSTPRATSPGSCRCRRSRRCRAARSPST